MHQTSGSRRSIGTWNNIRIPDGAKTKGPRTSRWSQYDAWSYIYDMRHMRRDTERDPAMPEIMTININEQVTSLAEQFLRQQSADPYPYPPQPRHLDQCIPTIVMSI